MADGVEDEVQKLLELRDRLLEEAREGTDLSLQFRATMVEQKLKIRNQSETYKHLRDLEHSGRVDKVENHRAMSEKYREELELATEPDQVFPSRIDGYDLVRGRPPPSLAATQLALPYESI